METADPITAGREIRITFDEDGLIAMVVGSPAHFVSSTGHVYSVQKRSSDGSWRVLRLKTMRHSHGYPQVQVKRDGKWKPIRIHTLVAEAFLGPPPPGRNLVRHDDDDPNNNDYRNLLWGTQVENLADARRNGRVIGRPKTISDEVVQAIRDDRTRGSSYATIARTHGVSVSYVADVIKNRYRKENGS